MHRLPENLFVLSLRQDHFSKSTIKLLGRTPPFLYLKKGMVSVKFNQKDPLETCDSSFEREVYTKFQKKRL